YSDTTWKNLYCLLLEGTALGITSPTTLFCTATSYNAYSIPWYDGQYLRDPLHFPRGGGKEECLLPPHEREAVAEWLRRLQQKLARHKGQGINAERDEKIWEHLLGLMQAYLNELGGGNDTLKIDKDVLNMSG